MTIPSYSPVILASAPSVERAAIDPIWIHCAERIGLPVERGGDAYVHFDGRVLYIATDEHLDPDDTIAQLVLHEICHWLIEGPGARHRADWGLDNTTDEDRVREDAAVRLQAHLLGAFGLRSALFPTTPVRALFDALGADALGRAGDPDPATALARVAAARAGRDPFAKPIVDALEETARVLGIALHSASGRAIVDDARCCGDCAWRTASGWCRRASKTIRVEESERACAAHEPPLDCIDCGACCRSGYDSVTVGARDPVRRTHPDLIVYRGNYLEVARTGDRCAALDGPPAGPYHCRIYEDRPRTCRDFEAAGRHCLTARRRVGLTV